MAEMADAGEDHGDAKPICGGDYVLIFDAAAGLDDGGCASSSDCFKSIGERKKGI